MGASWTAKVKEAGNHVKEEIKVRECARFEKV